MDLLQQSAMASVLSGEQAAPLRAAVATAAVQIINEDPTTALHAERVALAKRCLRDPGSITDTFAWVVTTNQTVVDKWAAGDVAGAWGDVPFVISTIWDALAQSWADL